MKEKLRYILSKKDCIFNQRSLEFRQALENLNLAPATKLLNILVIGPSRAGKSTLCNTLLNKYEALESNAAESVTQVVNEYANDYFHLYDTPGITITKNNNLGDTSKIVINCLKNVIKKFMIL
jgi:ribosome biogenesis GTPase A